MNSIVSPLTPEEQGGDMLMANVLEKELKTYQEKLAELKGQEGKFVLIHGDRLVDVFGTYEDAVKAGYEQFKLEPFLVKQIHAIEQVQFVTRLLIPSCPT